MKQTENLINIFLASSEELKLERVYIGDFINDINSNITDTAVRIRLLKWEFFDPGFRGERKQSEYDEKVKKADIFITLFRKKAGGYTKEECQTAVSAHEENGKPKELYCFFQDCDEKRNFEIEELKKELGSKFVYNNFTDINELKYKLIKIIQPYLEKNNIEITETDKFVKIGPENLLRKN